jgi:hypothetical protein
MSKLPRECGTVLTAGGFEPPVPANADPLPEPVLKALASKETGPPPPQLDAAARQALIRGQLAGAVARAKSETVTDTQLVTSKSMPSKV